MVRARKTPDNAFSSWPSWVPYALVTLAVFAAFANIYGNEFVGDDAVLIAGNRYLRDWGSVGRIFSTSALSGSGAVGDLYRPLHMLLDLVIYQLFGLQVVAYHAVNVGLQVANGYLVYALGRKLNFRPLAVLLAALIWALHPLEAESVTHISGAADLLFPFFCLLGVLIMLPDFTPRKIAYACPLFVLALLSKEAAAIFPLLVMATIYLASPRRAQARIYLRTWPLWLIAAIYLALRFTLLDFQSADQNFSALNPAGYDYATHFFYRFYTCLATLPLYLEYMVWPARLHFEIYFPVYTSPMHGQVLLGGVLVLAAIGQILWGRARRGLALSWGLLWFGAALAPDTGLLVPANFLFSEHWMYLPSAGLFLGVAQTLATAADRLRDKKIQMIGIAAGVALIGIAGFLTFQQNRVWRDPFTLYSYMLSFNEPLPRLHADMAEVYMRRGEYNKSLAELRVANGLLDTIPEVHQDIAYILMQQLDWRSHADEAIAELKRALVLRPNYLSAYQGLANIYGRLGDGAQEAVYRDKIWQLQKE